MKERINKYYPWVVVGLLWVVALMNYLDRQMLSTMQSAIAGDITELQEGEKFGFLMAIFLWVYAVVSPFAGGVADKLSRKWLIVGSLAVWSTVTLMMGFCTTFKQLFWLRALMGVSEALYIPSSLSLIAEYHKGKSRSLAVGIHMTGLYIGQAMGGFGATFANLISWQQAFFYLGLSGVIYAVVLILFLKDIRREDQPVAELKAAPESEAKPSLWKGFALVFSNMAFWAILFFFASSSFPGWGTKNWLPTLFVDNLGLDMTVAGPMATITIAAASFVGVIVGGSLSDKWVKNNLKGRVYTSAIGLAMMIPALVLLGLGHTITTLLAAGILFGVGYGMFDTNNMPILCQFVPVRLRGTAYGLMNTVGVAMGALCTTILGPMKDKGQLGMAFALMGIMTAAALAVQLLFLRPKTDDMQ